MSNKNQTGAATSAAPSTGGKKGRKPAETKETAKGAAVKKPASESENKAMKLAVQLGVRKLWENELGEYFTAEDRALLSVGKDPKKIITHDFTGSFVATGAATSADDDNASEGEEKEQENTTNVTGETAQGEDAAAAAQDEGAE